MGGDRLGQPIRGPGRVAFRSAKGRPFAEAKGDPRLSLPRPAALSLPAYVSMPLAKLEPGTRYRRLVTVVGGDRLGQTIPGPGLFRPETAQLCLEDDRP